jgi:hypothetical protein
MNEDANLFGDSDPTPKDPDKHDAKASLHCRNTNANFLIHARKLKG